MKKILLSILVVVFVISCGQKPEKTVSNFINNIKVKNIKEASKYVTDGDELSNNIKLEYNSEVQKQLFQSLFQNLKYNIEKVEKINKNTSIVTVDIENIDVKGVFLEVFKKMIHKSIMEDSQSVTIEKTFSDVLVSNNVPKSTNKVEFVVSHKFFENKIELNPETVDVMFGGIVSAFKNLDETLDNVQKDTNKSSNDENKEKVETEGPTAGNDQKLPETKINKK